jgi:hypothetical protein
LRNSSSSCAISGHDTVHVPWATAAQFFVILRDSISILRHRRVIFAKWSNPCAQARKAAENLRERALILRAKRLC